MNKTPIQWTDYSSNPLRAVNTDTGKRGWFCTHASPGCENCYSEALNKRLGNGLAYTAPNRKRVRFEVDEREFKAWQRLKPGERVFVCDMTDLFHEDIPDETIDRAFNAMAASRGTFQVLTKRAARLPDYFARWALPLSEYPNIWVGVSVEDQRRADERIPHLLKVPAAVRFLSVEPLLAPVDLTKVNLRRVGEDREAWTDALAGAHFACDSQGEADWGCERIGWVIVGGESGPAARPCNVAWVRSVVAQCHAAGVPAFVKQLGKWVAGDAAGFCVQRWLLEGGGGWVPPLIGPWAKARPENAVAFGLADQKGGDWAEWPADLRVREMPDEERGEGDRPALEAAGQLRLI